MTSQKPWFQGDPAFYETRNKNLHAVRMPVPWTLPSGVPTSQSFALTLSSIGTKTFIAQRRRLQAAKVDWNRRELMSCLKMFETSQKSSISRHEMNWNEMNKKNRFSHLPAITNLFLSMKIGSPNPNLQEPKIFTYSISPCFFSLIAMQMHVCH